MKAIRCRCTCIYPDDMLACPTCGRNTNDNVAQKSNVSTKRPAYSDPKEWRPIKTSATHKYLEVDYKNNRPNNPRMISCDACLNQISIRAETCPHCGNPTGVHICPKCGSAKTKVISGASKAVSVGLWGIFAANKVMSKFECKDCGHRF